MRHEGQHKAVLTLLPGLYVKPLIIAIKAIVSNQQIHERA